jgi:hypothetical protein
MSETYSVKGNVEWLFEGAWVDLISNDFDAKDFWPDVTINVRPEYKRIQSHYEVLLRD